MSSQLFQKYLVENEHRPALHTRPDKPRSDASKTASDALGLVHELQAREDGGGVECD